MPVSVHHGAVGSGEFGASTTRDMLAPCMKHALLSGLHTQTTQLMLASLQGMFHHG